MAKLIAKVISGTGKGKTIGFPTINLRLKREDIPKKGVYAVKCWYNNKEYKGVGSVSDNPTFPEKGFSIEVFLFDFNKDISGQEIKVDFLHKLRDEKRFNDAKELANQISKDVEQARRYFKE